MNKKELKELKEIAKTARLLLVGTIAKIDEAYEVECKTFRNCEDCKAKNVCIPYVEVIDKLNKVINEIEKEG